MIDLDTKNPAIIKNRKKKIIIAGFIIVFFAAIIIAVYPFLPLIKYYLYPKPPELPGVPELLSSESEDLEVDVNSLPEAQTKDNLLVISKIGINIPILEGKDESVLNKGAWRLPETSTPDKGSNTVITGHRWKYRPPSEKTFYLLDKLEIGDSFKIFWQGKEYNYRVISTSVVLPKDVWVLNPTQKSTVTLITCTPLFSTAKRLIVKGELVGN